MQLLRWSDFQNLSLSVSLNSAGKVNVLCGLDRSGIDVFLRKGFYSFLQRPVGAWI